MVSLFHTRLQPGATKGCLHSRTVSTVATYLTNPAFEAVLLAALPQHIAVSLWLTVSPPLTL